MLKKGWQMTGEFFREHGIKDDSNSLKKLKKGVKDSDLFDMTPTAQRSTYAVRISAARKVFGIEGDSDD